MDAENLKNAEVSFLSYYKYIFSYNILLNGKPIGILMIGGDCDEIYRLEVKAEEKRSLRDFLSEEAIKELIQNKKYGDITEGIEAFLF